MVMMVAVIALCLSPDGATLPPPPLFPLFPSQTLKACTYSGCHGSGEMETTCSLKGAGQPLSPAPPARTSSSLSRCCRLAGRWRWGVEDRSVETARQVCEAGLRRVDSKRRARGVCQWRGCWSGSLHFRNKGQGFIEGGSVDQTPTGGNGDIVL